MGGLFAFSCSYARTVREYTSPDRASRDSIRADGVEERSRRYMAAPRRPWAT
jgi:hypothetical protein